MIFLTSNKKKQILKSTGKAVLIIGCVALFSYFGISYLESNKEKKPNNTDAIIVDNSEVNVSSENNNDSALDLIEAPEEKEEKPEYVAPANVTTSGDWQYYILEGQNVICGYIGKDENVILPLKIDGITFTTFDKGTFFYNENVKSISIPIGYKEIPEEAFVGCKNLVEINIPETVTIIKGHAFDYCESLETLNLSSKIETIEDTAFIGLSNIKNIKVDENNPNYKSKDGMLYNKKESKLIKAVITSDTLTLPNDLQEIGSFAISQNENLKTIIMPEYLNKIYSYAIYKCPNIETINISSSVGTIEDYAFYGSKIKSFSVEKRSKYYAEVDGILYNKAKDKIICFPSGKTGEYTLNAETRYISSGAFVNVSLTRLNIPSTLYQIYTNAFIDSKDLTIYSDQPDYEFLKKCQKNWNVNYKGKIVYE